MVPPAQNFWPGSPHLDEECRGQPEGLLAHTIDNNNPYDGIMSVKPGQG